MELRFTRSRDQDWKDQVDKSSLIKKRKNTNEFEIKDSVGDPSIVFVIYLFSTMSEKMNF